MAPWNPSGNQQPLREGDEEPAAVWRVTFWERRVGPTLRMVPVEPITVVRSSGPKGVEALKVKEAWPRSNWTAAWARKGGRAR